MRSQNISRFLAKVFVFPLVGIFLLAAVSCGAAATATQAPTPLPAATPTPPPAATPTSLPTPTPTRTSALRSIDVSGCYTVVLFSPTYRFPSRGTIRLEQRGRDLAGNLESFGPHVDGGPVLGSVEDNRIQFTVQFASVGLNARAEFEGFVAPDGSLDGSYKNFRTQRAGTWQDRGGC